MGGGEGEAAPEIIPRPGEGGERKELMQVGPTHSIEAARQLVKVTGTDNPSGTYGDIHSVAKRSDMEPGDHDLFSREQSINPPVSPSRPDRRPPSSPFPPGSTNTPL